MADPSPDANRLARPVGIITRTGPGELTQTAMDVLLAELLVERFGAPLRRPAPAPIPVFLGPVRLVRRAPEEDPDVIAERQRILVNALDDRHLIAVRRAA